MLDALLVKLNYAEVLEEDKEFDLGTAYLASALRRAGFTVEIIDASLEGLSYNEMLMRIVNRPSRLIGISVWLQRLVADAEHLVKDLRSHNINAHITMGGHSTTFLYQEILEHNNGLDSVVCGEGEEILIELLSALTSKAEWRSIPGVASIHNNILYYDPRPTQDDLDSFASPALDYARLVKERGQFMSLLTSRGCYGRCTFCSTNPFYRLGGGKAWRGHSPERVLTELRQLTSAYGFEHFGFRDDNFVGPGQLGRARAHAIATGIKEAGLNIKFYIACRVNDIDKDLFIALKEAGLTRVFLGVESGSQRRLDAFNKGVKVEENIQAIRLLVELGIPFTIGYIMFSPDTTWEEFKESSAFLRDTLGTIEGVSDAVHDMFNIVEVLPGTAVVEELRLKGQLKGDRRGYTYEFTDRRVALFYKTLRWLRKVASPLGKGLEQQKRKQRYEELSRGL